MGPDHKVPLDILTNQLSLYFFLAEPRTLGDFYRRVKAILHRMGMSSFAFAHMQQNRDVSASIGNIVVECQRLYREYDFGRDDMSVEAATLSDEPILMSKIRRIVDTAEVPLIRFQRNRDLLRMMGDFGYYNYWNAAFQSCSGKGRALIAFGAEGVSSDDFDSRANRNQTTLVTLAKTIDQIGHTNFPQEFGHTSWLPVHLGPKALLLLYVIGKYDVTTKAAARMCKMHISTANYHLEAARLALRVNTIPALMRKSEQLGLFELEIPLGDINLDTQ